MGDQVMTSLCWTRLRQQQGLRRLIKEGGAPLDTSLTVLLEIFSSFPGSARNDETVQFRMINNASIKSLRQKIAWQNVETGCLSLAQKGERTLCLVVNGRCRESIVRSVLLPPDGTLAPAYSPQSLYFVLNTIPMGCLHWSAPDPKSIKD